MTAEVLERYDRAGPRYTSYPTAVEFHTGFGAAEYSRHLDRAAGSTAPLSLYVHLPFCESRCSFCGCHVVIARNPTVADAYLRHLEDEAAILADHLGDRRQVAQYHWGGGTPTLHHPDLLARLYESVAGHFSLAESAEVAVEVDPRVTTSEHLAVLRSLGFNRLSMGVQDADTNVQDLIGRGQTWEQTVNTFEQARSLGYESINVDLIYGLPGQNARTFADTLDLVTGLRPDRFAIYSFAYVPWVRPNQKRIDTGALPSRTEKYTLLSMAIDRLVDEGYRAIGMDHFALPDDELSVAAQRGSLTRTFMGYTTARGTDTVALGSSGISDVAGAYAQNHKRLASYYTAIEAGELPIERGIALSEDDRVRREVITELMCNSAVVAARIGEQFGIDFHTYFEREIGLLCAPGGLVEEGMAIVDDQGVRATRLGSTFIRNLAMVFDAHLPSGEPGSGSTTPVFSRTV